MSAAVIGSIRPGAHLTRGGDAVYIACRCSVNPDGSTNHYPWWVEAKGGGWSVDEQGRHMKNARTQFDIVARATKEQP